ncbi:unnamed protein product [Merluccius merluccius]
MTTTRRCWTSRCVPGLGVTIALGNLNNNNNNAGSPLVHHHPEASSTAELAVLRPVTRREQKEVQKMRRTTRKRTKATYEDVVLMKIHLDMRTAGEGKARICWRGEGGALQKQRWRPAKQHLHWTQDPRCP